ncbi:hypothetical protein [Cupriavidus sp. IDO]|nr:hypothetical protein [Cupriavidus sp. IDO]
MSHKDSRSTVVRTMYGKVTVNSPRLTVKGRFFCWYMMQDIYSRKLVA